jgi:hypothetical protein
LAVVKAMVRSAKGTPGVAGPACPAEGRPEPAIHDVGWHEQLLLLRYKLQPGGGSLPRFTLAAPASDGSGRLSGFRKRSRSVRITARTADWCCMFGGKYLNKWHMAELHAQEAPDRVRELEQWGAVFDRTPDRKVAQRAFGGHTYRRLVHIGDRTGLELIRTLQDKVVHEGIDVFMECTITRLLKDGDRVCGAFGYRRATGEFLAFAAPAVVLATGGGGRSWRITSNSWECMGDGYALAYEAGAELVDMEFVQFHPTGMVWPPGVIGLLVTEAVRGEGGILRNATGERFMERYDPKRLELSTRDVVARAIHTVGLQSDQQARSVACRDEGLRLERRSDVAALRGARR